MSKNQEGKNKVEQSSVSSLLMQAYVLVEQKQFEEAQRLLQQVLREEPNNSLVIKYQQVLEKAQKHAEESDSEDSDVENSGESDGTDDTSDLDTTECDISVDNDIVHRKSSRQNGSRRHRFKKEQRRLQEKNKLIDAENATKREKRLVKRKKLSGKTKKTNLNVEFVVAAIEKLDERKGSSFGAISNKLIKGGFMVNNPTMIRRAVQKGVGVGRLIKEGARFKVNPNSKPLFKDESPADIHEDVVRTNMRSRLVFSGSRFRVDDRIEARYNGDDEWYTGFIAAVRSDFTYDIAYDDGDMEERVPPEFVRIEKKISCTSPKAVDSQNENRLKSSNLNSPQVFSDAYVEKDMLTSSSTSPNSMNFESNIKEEKKRCSMKRVQFEINDEINDESNEPSKKKSSILLGTKNKNIDLMQTKGFKIKDLIIGSSKSEAISGSKITVSYKGKLRHTGQIFDQSKSFSFTIDDGNVIKGWDIGILGMRIGGKRRLTIPSSLAYGTTGSPGGVVPPNSTLIFIVKLIGIDTIV